MSQSISVADRDFNPKSDAFGPTAVLAQHPVSGWEAVKRPVIAKRREVPDVPIPSLSEAAVRWICPLVWPGLLESVCVQHKVRHAEMRPPVFAYCGDVVGVAAFFRREECFGEIGLYGPGSFTGFGRPQRK